MGIPFKDEDILPALAGIIREALRVPTEKIVPGARIFGDLGAESIDILDIRFRIEETFGIKIPEGDIIRSIDPGQSLEQLKERFTVGSVADYVRNRLSAEAQSP